MKINKPSNDLMRVVELTLENNNEHPIVINIVKESMVSELNVLLFLNNPGLYIRILEYMTKDKLIDVSKLDAIAKIVELNAGLEYITSIKDMTHYFKGGIKSYNIVSLYALNDNIFCITGGVHNKPPKDFKYYGAGLIIDSNSKFIFNSIIEIPYSIDKVFTEIEADNMNDNILTRIHSKTTNTI